MCMVISKIVLADASIYRDGRFGTNINIPHVRISHAA